MTYIGVIGSSECDQETEKNAYEVGRQIALKEAILICGGYGGVMNSAAKGAKDNGGLTVGILSGETRKGASPYLDISLPTDMGQARNAIIAASSDSLIAIGGEFGTLSEIGLALKMGKKVIGINTWEVLKKNTICSDIIYVKTPFEAVDLATNHKG